MVLLQLLQGRAIYDSCSTALGHKLEGVLCEHSGTSDTLCMPPVGQFRRPTSSIRAWMIWLNGLNPAYGSHVWHPDLRPVMLRMPVEICPLLCRYKEERKAGCRGRYGRLHWYGKAVDFTFWSLLTFHVEQQTSTHVSYLSVHTAALLHLLEIQMFFS